ncbi:EAL domain-containing protein [Pantoea agglomerans]|uniref:EAL domain-containing protein n=1 Tax=Enterobacter agglomerans TaxID=549 RepID=UPI0010C073EE|nr:EAL domain-containing protein [Pantoea agglomerans]MBD8145622.1 EAL domain-containing protein [Pantoea agglomerans]MBD8182449.1 EAL domain-containing protein [Pantoea agglomerans]MBD8223718.1 EAL domain-containing protein [Pantoea agglomerans]TKJ54629.1 cyclic diguanylate phosphodiesterase [Pantoea agglomerans]TKK16598.1 cyclic diguanylate phosphodiesterase [Pantoea agglomerans]
MPLLKRKRDYARLVIIISGVVPLVIGIFFTSLDARHTVQQQQVNAANTLLSQAERMSDSAWDMITKLHQFQHQPCSQFESELRRIGSLNPYFRTIGKMEQDKITCSSGYGTQLVFLKDMILRDAPEKGETEWSLSIAGTSGVPDRPAVMFMQHLPDGEGFWVLVDGQYLIDFMRAISSSHLYHFSMTFSGGAPISFGDPHIAASSWFEPMIYQALSHRYPLSVTLIASPSELISAWRQVMFIIMPMAAIFSILLMMLMANWLKRRISWRDEIRRAITSGQFRAHYQPFYDNRLQRCSGAEALLRWTTPDGNGVRPDVFIGAAEAEGMIVPLTRHLLDLIAEDVQAWQVEPHFHLAINVAADHLQHPDFVDDMLQFAGRVKDKQFLITLELTERSLIKDGAEVARKLEQLRGCGMKVAIDDFGTGHCSLSYLQTFTMDYLKIDRGFINAIESLEGRTPVLDAIIQLSHELELEVLGEGVETALQFSYLQRRGVVFIQGYYYARPMDNTALVAWLTDRGEQPIDREPALQTRQEPDV